MIVTVFSVTFITLTSLVVDTFLLTNFSSCLDISIIANALLDTRRV